MTDTAAQTDPDLLEAERIAELAMRRVHSIGATDEDVLASIRFGMNLGSTLPEAGLERLRHVLRLRAAEFEVPVRQIDAVLGVAPPPKPQKPKTAKRESAKVVKLPPSDALPDGVEVFSDLANAHRLGREHGQELRHCPQMGGWHRFSGRRWARDESGAICCVMQVMQRLMLFAVQLVSRAKTKDDSERAEAYLRWARKSQSEPAIRRALLLAQNLPPIACRAEDFDRDPWLFNCTNGTLDLRTGVLGPHRADDMISRLAGCAYRADAPAERWLRFLERMQPDPEVRAFIQRATGYSLTASNAEQCMFVEYGTGGNGKSTKTEAVQRVMGDYGAAAQMDTFMRVGQRGADNDLARIRNARLVTAVETTEGRKLDEARIKQLTGGDTIAARFLYREAFEFVACMKIWLAVNHRPEVSETDEGIWRRLMLIPWSVQIPEAERDPKLGEALAAEAEGVLAWAVQGCLAWQRDGLAPPQVVRAVTSEWRQESDAVGQFIEDRCVKAEFAQATAAALYGAYCEWARGAGAEPRSQKWLGSELKRLGYVQRRTGRNRLWLALGLAQEGGDA